MIKMWFKITSFSIYSTVSGIEQGRDSLEAGFNIVEKIPNQEPFWYFIYLFILLAIYAWISVYYSNELVQTFQASINFSLTNKMFNNKSLLQNQLDAVLYLYYFLSLTFMLYFMELRTGVIPLKLQGALLFLFNFGLLAVLFFGRLMLHNIAGFLFNRTKIIREYLYNMFVFNKLSGLVILPLMFLVVYTRGSLQDIVFWTIIFALSGILVMRLIRGVVFSYKKDVLNFYMFLYLCALEIIPLVLLYRWLEGIL
jgi:hypothetical protein